MRERLAAKLTELDKRVSALETLVNELRPAEVTIDLDLDIAVQSAAEHLAGPIQIDAEADMVVWTV